MSKPRSLLRSILAVGRLLTGSLQVIIVVAALVSLPSIPSIIPVNFDPCPEDHPLRGISPRHCGVEGGVGPGGGGGMGGGQTDSPPSAVTGPDEIAVPEHEEDKVTLTARGLVPTTSYQVRYVWTDGSEIIAIPSITSDSSGSFTTPVYIDDTGPSGSTAVGREARSTDSSASASTQAQIHVFSPSGQCVAIASLAVARSLPTAIELEVPAAGVTGGTVPIRTGYQGGPQGSHRGYGRIHIEVERGEQFVPGTAMMFPWGPQS